MTYTSRYDYIFDSFYSPKSNCDIKIIEEHIDVLK